jgi:hypothetical protein
MKNLRLLLIEALIITKGAFRRSDLMSAGNIGSAQATRTLARYQEFNPQGISYDTSGKEYVAASDFRPLLIKSKKGAVRFLRDIELYIDANFKRDVITAFIVHNGSMSRTDIQSLFSVEAAQSGRIVAAYKKEMPHVETIKPKGLCFPACSGAHETPETNPLVLDCAQRLSKANNNVSEILTGELL